ncbi:MAG TPA: MMPL family transporter [Polyangiaceae bacterium]|nr:MMPL family transporter [Polyangiaceae bacterium]
MSPAARRWGPVLAVALAALVAAWLVGYRVRLDPDVASLLPDRGEAASLARYARAFGGGDAGVVLVEGDDPSEVEAAAAEVARGLGEAGFGPAYDRLSLPSPPPASAWFLLAGGSARAAIERSLEPEAMRARLAETRSLLLAPGGSALGAWVRRDPLRLGQLAAETRRGRGELPTRADGALASGDGRARLVVARPPGNSLRSGDAARFVRGAEAVLARVGAARPGVRLRLGGGHAYAVATEAIVRRDIAVSSSLSLALAALAFVLTFGRPRALFAVLPPLAAGTLVTAAAAALFPAGLSAVAVAFASVVIGVGTDAGVHAYAALVDCLAEGAGDPVAAARRRVARPVLGAALVAASAFGCIALSRVSALRQLGLLSALGEVVTALCILAVTPPLALLLESRRRDAPRGPPRRWAAALARALEGRRARAAAAAAAALVALAALALGPPPGGGALVAVRPEGLAPVEVYRDIERIFQQKDEMPWVLLVADADPDRAELRAAALAEALAARPGDVAAVDALGDLAPGPALQRQRAARRAALGLPAREGALGAALAEAGFAPDRFAEALADFRAPAAEVDVAPLRALVAGRYVAQDGGETLVATYVYPAPGRAEALAALAAAVDPGAALTGFPRLEPTLRATLADELPRALALASALLAFSLGLSLRRWRHVAAALGAVATVVAAVALAMRATGTPLHLYNALVLPALLGITVDEVLFVLFATRGAGGRAAWRGALAREAPVVAATACTTAAGFAALLACRYAPLRHIGVVGAAGSLLGLLVALTLVPALTYPRELRPDPLPRLGPARVRGRAPRSGQERHARAARRRARAAPAPRRLRRLGPLPRRPRAPLRGARGRDRARPRRLGRPVRRVRRALPARRARARRDARLRAARLDRRGARAAGRALRPPARAGLRPRPRRDRPRRRARRPGRRRLRPAQPERRRRRRARARRARPPARGPRRLSHRRRGLRRPARARDPRRAPQRPKPRPQRRRRRLAHQAVRPGLGARRLRLSARRRRRPRPRGRRPRRRPPAPADGRLRRARPRAARRARATPARPARRQARPRRRLARAPGGPPRLGAPPPRGPLRLRLRGRRPRPRPLRAARARRPRARRARRPGRVLRRAPGLPPRVEPARRRAARGARAARARPRVRLCRTKAPVARCPIRGACARASSRAPSRPATNTTTTSSAT